MPSPFPGMDPYLEGYLWPDLHQRLATKISQLLTPRLRPRYVARLAITIVEDQPGEAELGIFYPDVEVLTAGRRTSPRLRESIELEAPATPTIEAPLTVPFLEMRVVTIEVRDVAHNQLVTSIEILSPVNKREPGLTEHRNKWERLHRAGVHVLELDLLRRGSRRLADARLRDAPYLVMLTRAHVSATGVWPLGLQERLPVVPVPLRAPDPDVTLDLQTALNEAYDEAAYDLSIDYRQPPPPPPFAAEDAAWMAALLQER